MEVIIFGDEGEQIVQMPACDFLPKYSNASTLTHTVHSLECHQLPFSTITTNQPSSPPISTCNIPTASSADERSAEILETSQPNTTPATVSLKDHPRSDSHTSTSSRGRALKTKRAE
ncbi:hypothetical protein OROMI_006121 [Orobanche minor]